MSRRYEYDDRGSAGAGLSIFALILGLLMMAGAGGLYYLTRQSQSDPQQSADPIILDTPATLVGLIISNDAQLTQAAAQMKQSITSDVPNAASSIAAYYSDPKDAKKLIAVAGVSAEVNDPKTALDQVFAGIADKIKPEAVHAVDPGERGGETRCGAGTAEGVSLVVCAWADSGSVAVVMFFNRPTAESEALFPAIRSGLVVASS